MQDAEDQEPNVFEERADHTFRTELPNILRDLDIGANEIHVYFHLKCIAGDNGDCWKSIPNLAKDCKMSENTLRKSLKILSSDFEILSNRPLIKITERRNSDGSCRSNLIEITPIWRVNGDFHRNKAKSAAASKKPPSSKVEPSSSTPRERGGSEVEPKQDPIKQDLLQEVVCSAEAAVPPTDALKASLSSCIKKHPDGSELHVSLESVFNHAVMHRTNWSVPEITEAWKILCDYMGPVRTWEKFIEGTIKNLRNAIKYAPITKKTQDLKCKTNLAQSSNTSENVKDSSLESVTSRAQWQQWISEMGLTS